MSDEKFLNGGPLGRPHMGFHTNTSELNQAILLPKHSDHHTNAAERAGREKHLETKLLRMVDQYIPRLPCIPEELEADRNMVRFLYHEHDVNRILTVIQTRKYLNDSCTGNALYWFNDQAVNREGAIAFTLEMIGNPGRYSNITIPLVDNACNVLLILSGLQHVHEHFTNVALDFIIPDEDESATLVQTALARVFEHFSGAVESPYSHTLMKSLKGGKVSSLAIDVSDNEDRTFLDDIRDTSVEELTLHGPFNCVSAVGMAQVLPNIAGTHVKKLYMSMNFQDDVAKAFSESASALTTSVSLDILNLFPYAEAFTNEQFEFLMHGVECKHVSVDKLIVSVSDDEQVVVVSRMIKNKSFGSVVILCYEDYKLSHLAVKDLSDAVKRHPEALSTDSRIEFLNSGVEQMASKKLKDIARQPMNET